MKTIFTLALITVLGLSANAQKTYTISSATSWSTANYPSYCSSCTFNISSGVKLTIDASWVTCANCVFTGGNIAVAKDFTCQSCSFTSDSISLPSTSLNLQSSTNTFTSVVLIATGTGSVTANAPVNITSSIFRFSGTGYFNNNNGTLNMSKSQMYFSDATYFLANAGPVNLKNTSSLNAGDGTAASTAYILMNGPQLNIYDNSYISIAAKNNSYQNWSSYYSASNNKYYSTAVNTVNCGGAGQNKCVAPKVYGPVTLNSAGMVTGSALPVVLTDLKASVQHTSVSISWETQQEMNASHFEIERSNDGTNWEKIGSVDAKGTTTSVTAYSFEDASPLNGTNYYRLQMVDLDGAQSSSAVLSVSIAETQGKIGIYPNPIVNSTFNVKVADASATIAKVFTTEGKLLTAFSLTGQTQYQLQLPTAAQHGSYLAIQIINNGKTETIMVMNK